MKVSVENLENDVVRLKIEVDDQLVEEELNKAYKRLVGRLSIPGFRKGKAPRWVVEKRYGRGLLLEESYENIINRAYRQALSETKVEPMAQADISEVDFAEDGTNFCFVAEVPVRPKVELGTYKGIEQDKIDPVVTDEDVENAIEMMRHRYAEYVTVDRDELQDGDLATVDIETFVDGKPIPGGAELGLVIRMGSDQLGPDTDSQLIGLKVGEERTITTTLSEDFGDEYAGKEATIKVALNEISELRLPELDAEFIKDLESNELQEEEEVATETEETDEADVTEETDDEDVVEAFKKRIRRNLEERAKASAEQEYENNLLTKVIEGSKFNLHDKIVSERAQEILRRYENRLSYFGLSLDSYLMANGLSKEAFQNILEKEAIRNLSYEFVMEAIAEAEGITVTDEEIDQWVKEMLNNADATAEQIAPFRELAETELKRTKAAELVVDSSVPNIIQKTLSEMSAEPEEVADDAADKE
ncbi:MAG TPA: trigger factor [Firmicutes bacterium]|nr:trigger factor [Bacillota bacterium]